jgi:hypothetical protein
MAGLFLAASSPDWFREHGRAFGWEQGHSNKLNLFQTREKTINKTMTDRLETKQLKMTPK